MSKTLTKLVSLCAIIDELAVVTGDFSNEDGSKLMDEEDLEFLMNSVSDYVDVEEGANLMTSTVMVEFSNTIYGMIKSLKEIKDDTQHD